MLRLDIKSESSRPLHILCLGAHCDDIELGCGATVLALIDRHPDAVFHWVVFSSSPVREKEATDSANDFLSAIDRKKIVVKQFRGSYFPFIGAEVKEYFEQIKAEFSPDLIFTHYRDDRHQDHQLVSDLTWNTFRDHLIFEYEILKYDGDLGKPNTYHPVSREHCDRKINLIQKYFVSQQDKSWFDSEAFMAMLRIRGVECNAESGLAEAFYARKISI
jgi:LmbE family N-acetylglucosaminyl deacetylase